MPANQLNTELKVGNILIDDKGLNERERAVLTKAVAQFSKSPDGMVSLYQKKNPSRILNVDTAAELFASYNQNRSENRVAINKVAQAVTHLVMQNYLNHPDPERDRLVIFTAGGPASFKTTATKGMTKLAEVKPQFILDSNLADFKIAKMLIDKVVNKGNDVLIIYSYLDPIQAFYSNLERAGNKERVVNLITFARQHVRARKNIIKLVAYYQNHPHVTITLRRNERKSIAKKIGLNQLARLEYHGKKNAEQTGASKANKKIQSGLGQSISTNCTGMEKEELLAAITEITRKKYQEGKLSEQVYQGLIRGL